MLFYLKILCMDWSSLYYWSQSLPVGNKSFVNVLPPIETGASCFNENSATDSKELRRLTLSPQA